MTNSRHTHISAGGCLAVAAALALAACGSSSTPTTSTVKPASSNSSSAAYAVKVATVPNVGSVLVDGKGRTLYMLSSEKGANLTCIHLSGCTAIWPPSQLPSGVTHGIAGSGVNASMLGTKKGSDGKLYLTYGPSHWPLYTYSGDSGAGQAHGQGIKHFGGTWWVLNAAGNPVTATASTNTSTTTASGGY